jgi:amidase
MNIDVFDNDLGAFCRETHVALKGAEAGALSGLSFGAKDVLDVAGHKSGCGNPDWLASHPPATVTAPALQLLLDAGADLAGKTQTDELTYSLMGENAHYGTPVNVNAPGRIPGGSSSGSAAAVAGELVDFAIGTDCGGSVRLPASFCGLYGFRPSHGRITLDGCMPLASSFDTFGWFAREAGTLARVGEALLEETPRAMRPKRLLFAGDAFEAAGPEVTAALMAVLDVARAFFGDEDTAVISGDGLEACFDTFRTLQGAEIWATHKEWIERVRPSFGPGIRERFEWASTVGEADAMAARKRREMFSERVYNMLSDGSVLCLPTSPGIAPERGASGDELDDFRARAMALLCTAGLAGLPQITLPLAKLENCPLGLSLVGRRGSDMELLTLAEDLAVDNIFMSGS